MDSIIVKSVEQNTVKTGQTKWDVKDTQGRYVTLWCESWPDAPIPGSTVEGDLAAKNVNGKTYYTLYKPKANGRANSGGSSSNSAAAMALLENLHMKIDNLTVLVSRLAPRPGTESVRVQHTPMPVADDIPPLGDEDLPF